jgi:ADP-ribosylglycohydrolase
MKINLEEYKQKVLGCWMGKNIGGTLGAPEEWKRQKNNYSFYSQDLNGNPLPNDDLDIQLLWLIALEEKGINLDARLLGEYWMMYVTPHWSEYGTAKINMRNGLMPPLSGSANNPMKDSCGAFIRSEIWACITPGCPEAAVRYAYEDATIDHGNGEGVYGEVFCAALESAAFVEKDLYRLIDIGLSYIPQDCGVAKAVRCAIDSYKAGRTWEEAREELLEKYRGALFCWSHIAAEDEAKGFREGKLGWDVPSNIGIVVIGLLYGEGDFGQSILIANNCGEDTDCTAATVGSIFGIVHGMDAIPEKWIKPIGGKIVTACLNLGELGSYGGQLPTDIYDLTRRVERITQQVILGRKLPVQLVANEETDVTDLKTESLFAAGSVKNMFKFSNGPVYRFDFFDVSVNYGEGAVIHAGTPKKIRLGIQNTYKTPERLQIQWYGPENFMISPAKKTSTYIPHNWYEEFGYKELEFEILMEKVENSINRFVIELTVNGKHTVMLVPIVLLNEM